MSEQPGSWERLVVDAPSARTMARPAEHKVAIETGLRVPMRDGAELGATLWRPAALGRYPVLLERAPHRLDARTGPAGEYYAARGYAVLGVNLRGCGASRGEFGADFGSPAGDGYDTIEWAAAQPWCNGRVGMLCGSISGYTSYQTATEAPPHLTALFVREGPGFGSIGGPGGGFGLLGLQVADMDWLGNRLEPLSPEQRSVAEARLSGFQNALRAAGRPEVADPNDPGRRAPILPVMPSVAHLPLAPHPLFAGVADEYNAWVRAAAHPTQENAQGLLRWADRIRVPTCHLGAWFDRIVTSTLAGYLAMGPGANQRLIIGPWVHGPQNMDQTKVGMLDLGPQAAVDLMAFRGRWYDHYLQDRTAELDGDPLVWLYVVGADRWIDAGSWPPAGATPQPWYLSSGDGAAVLHPEPPTTMEVGDSYAYDPREPVPSLAGGGPFGMAMDQGPLEHRLLCYTSAPLERPLALIGPLSATLHAASSAPDTDWVVRLSWVRPDGAAVVLSGGILRARYRASAWQPTLLDPGVPARFEITMMPLSVVIPTGDRLRLSITSSDFPAYSRNLNTCGPIDEEVEGRVANNTIYHDALRPSHIVLPVWE